MAGGEDAAVALDGAGRNYAELHADGDASDAHAHPVRRRASASIVGALPLLLRRRRFRLSAFVRRHCRHAGSRPHPQVRIGCHGHRRFTSDGIFRLQCRRSPRSQSRC